MKKEEIYVVIDSKETRLKALEILKKAGEKVYGSLRHGESLKFHTRDLDWYTTDNCNNSFMTEITLEQLEQILTLDQLKQQAEALGYELVEKKRVPKVGDFGVVWYEDSLPVYDFLSEIEKGKFVDMDGNVWDNFRYLTDEEKEKIQNNW